MHSSIIYDNYYRSNPSNYPRYFKHRLFNSELVIRIETMFSVCFEFSLNRKLYKESKGTFYERNRLIPVNINIIKF